MAIVNRKIRVKANSKKLSRAIYNSRYDSKYHENNDKLRKNISLRRDIDRGTYF